MSAPTAPSAAVPAPIRYLDVLLVVAFTPFALLAGLPALGWLVGAAAWIVQRIVGAWIDGATAAAADPKRAVGIGLAGVMGRAWLMGLTILAVGLLGEREDGLTAAILVLVAFTIYLALTVILRPQRNPS
jgi:hypothetical protein